MKYVQVGKWRIGTGYPCFVVAEASSNHGRSLRRAKKMIDVAVNAGADAVKFQVFSAATIAADTTDPRTIVRVKEKSVFVKKDTKLIDLYRPNELPRNWLPKLAGYAKKKGIMFLATPFDEVAVDQLEAVNVPIHKIASYEMQDVPLLRKVAQTRKPILLSTGMADLHDIAQSLKILKTAGSGPVILLHCRSMYPTPPEMVDLRVMEVMRKQFHLPVGFSDHTLGIGVPVAAVALGAVVVEKHFKLDDGMKTIDDQFSLGLGDLRMMIAGIRQAQFALGKARKQPTRTERKEKLLAARSLWVVKPIKKGERFTSTNVHSLRPGIGLPPLNYDLVLTMKAGMDIVAGTPLAKRHLHD